jgi:hypothetical protein
LFGAAFFVDDYFGMKPHKLRSLFLTIKEKI